MSQNSLLAAQDVLKASMQSIGWLQSKPTPSPSVAIVTGSGLGALAQAMQIEATVDFTALPGLAVDPGSTGVVGHALKWFLGQLGGTRVHLIAGRRHFYEGIDPLQTAATTRLMAMLGVRLVLYTNAAGGLVSRLWPGDLMLIRDHINFMFRNPLVGPNIWPDPNAPGPRFPDMCESYDPAACAMLRRAAQESGTELHEGIYGAVAGPNYETRAEIEMLRRMGADAVGMSTAPEAIAARHAGLRVAAISLITNSHMQRIADVNPTVTSHDEVIQEGMRAAAKISGLLIAAMPKLARLATAETDQTPNWRK